MAMRLNGLCACYFPHRWQVRPKGKKCIYILYSSHSKGYVFLREHKDESVTVIDSRDANFLEEEFSSKGEVSQDSDLY